MLLLVVQGEKYLAERVQGHHRQANGTWLRAVRLAPKPAVPGWAVHRSAARLWPCVASAAVREQLDRWRGLIAKDEDGVLRRRRASWDGWVDKAFDEKNSSKVYRFIRGPEVPTAAIVTPQEIAAGCTSFQQVVQRVADPWTPFWEPGGPESDFRPYECLPLALRALPCERPTADEFRGLAHTYRWNTAVGADHWQPRVLALLPDLLIDNLVALMWCMVLAGCVPRQIALLLIVLIQKAEVGQRPIGIFPTILRMLDRWMRWNYGKQWLRTQPAQGFYGCRGRTVEDAVWRQGLLTEWASEVGKSAVTFLLDLVKAFEHVRHPLLWEAARRHGFSLTALAWLICTFRLERRVCFTGGLAAPVCATRSVVPGSSFADILMRLAVVDVVLAAARRWPRMTVAVVVDDIQGTVYGHRDEVERDASSAAGFLVEELEARGLPVSQPKLQLTGNSWPLVKAIANRCKPLRRAAARSVRNLGADYAAGRRIVHRTRAKRLQKVLSRARRFRALGRYGRRGLKIARVALGPAALFAVSVTGLLDKHRQLLRRAFHATVVRKPAGRACTVDLALLDARADPTFPALVEPFVMLARETARGSSPTIMLGDCVAGLSRRAAANLGTARPRPLMQLATGPVSAAAASAMLVGWKPDDGQQHSWTSATGLRFDLRHAAPRSIRRVMEHDVETWLWQEAARRHAHLSHLDGKPYLEGIFDLLWGKSGSLDKRLGGLLRAFLAGAFFRTCTCQCGAHFAEPMFWWSHFVWQCPQTGEVREMLREPLGDLRPVPEALFGTVEAYIHTPWIATALLPDPRSRQPPPAEPEVVRWTLGNGDEALFSGDAFADGSCTRLNPQWRLAERAGWAIAEVFYDSVARKPVVGRWAAGTLPGVVQTPEGAELYPLLFWLRHLDPTTVRAPRLFTDCKRVADGYNGLWDVEAHDVPHRDWWLQIMGLKAESAAQVVWCKGHVPPAVAASYGCPARQLIALGNGFVDRQAKQAVKWHPEGPGVEQAICRTRQLSVHLAVAYARTLAWALESPGRLPERSVLCEVFRLPRPPPLPEHTFACDRAGCERCVHCGLPRGLAARQVCRPAGSLGHRFCALGHGVFCTRCGAYSFVQSRLLAAGCNGRPADAAAKWRRDRMLKGRHPVSGVFVASPVLVDLAQDAFTIMLGG